MAALPKEISERGGHWNELPLPEPFAWRYAAAMNSDKPDSDAFGGELLGAVILVGITHQTAAGDLQEQFFGTVERADAGGIELLLGGTRSGERFLLPPDPSNIFPAQPGSYKLRQTGEVVENPDYTATWLIQQQAP